MNAVPSGKKLSTNDVSTYRSETAANTVSSSASKPESGPSLAPVQPLLQKHTCVACHAEDKKVIGPAFTEIAKRNYSVDQIVQLIYEPQPSNWPDYPTPMPPMEHIPAEDLKQIAQWIQSLNAAGPSSPDARQ